MYNGINLSNCDLEPIHLIGKIQSHGYLISVNKQSLFVDYCSANIKDIYPILFNQSKLPNVYSIFDIVLIQFIENFIKENSDYCIYEDLVEINKKSYQVFISNAFSNINIEFEEVQNLEGHCLKANKCLIFIQNAIKTLDHTKSINQIASVVTHQLKQFSEYDRVMFYQFDENGAGEVIAEEKAFGLESFLGLKYPASDIPKQARILYLSNKVRCINNVDDIGIPIIPISNKYEKNEIDLSYAYFRSVSEIHLQYLRNMGVKATHAVSIVVNEELFGLLICHHYSESKHLKLNERLTTEYLGELIGSKINVLLTKEKNIIENNFNLLQKKIILDLLSGISLVNTITNYVEEITGLFKADELLYINNENFSSFKTQFSKTQIHQLIQFLLKYKSPIHAVNSLLNEGFILAAQFPFAGLLQIELSSSKNEYLILLRRDKVQTVNWAGNPNKPVELNDDSVYNLSPRKSFALWQETVRGYAECFTPLELELAEKFLQNIKYTQLTANKNNTIIANEPNVSNDWIIKLERENYQLKEHLQELKRKEVDLRAAKQSADNMNKIKSDFLSNLSHEMRTPLNGINGLSELIKMTVADPEVQEYAEMQIKSTERLLQTINKILEMSKIESNTITHNFEKINVVESVSNSLKPLKILAFSKQQQFIVNFHQNSSDFNIITDPLIFDQILINIVSNAIKYTPEGGKIEVNLKLIDQGYKCFLMLSVEDSGEGISQENLDKIFEKFFTEKDTTKQKDNSSGIGLYIVKKYVEYLQGVIKVESKKNLGSLFTVKIPITTS